MFYPLYLVTPDLPENRELLIKSLDTWLELSRQEEKEKGWCAFAAYTHTGASSMYASLGDGENALKYLNGFIDYPLVKPNSLYSESGPVLESPLSSAQCVHDMLIQSWGRTIRVFPAIPESWKSITFANLRTEGAFLVSASRREGENQWVRVYSENGGICKLVHNIESATLSLNSGYPEPVNRGQVEVKMNPGDDLVIKDSSFNGEIEIIPVDVSPCYMYGKTN
jgi:alpha-L-fucosidase 2